MNKLTQLHVYLIGGVLMGVVFAAMYFAMLKPLNDANASLLQQISAKETTPVSVDGQNFTIARWDPQATETTPTPAQVEEAQRKAEDALELARQRQSNKAAQLASIERRKSLPASRAIEISNDEARNLQVTMGRWLTLPRYVVTRMQSHARVLGSRHGVSVTTQFAAPAPSTNPAAIPRDIIAWNLGTMTVEGEFTRVMRWAEAWNQAPLLVSVEGLKCSLSDRGGKVQATCALVVYIFPTGEAVVNPGAAAAAGTQAAPGGALPPGAEGFGAAEGDPGMNGPG